MPARCAGWARTSPTASPAARPSSTRAWDSPGHRADILNGAYRLLGVGAAQFTDGVWYVAQVFGTLA